MVTNSTICQVEGTRGTFTAVWRGCLLRGMVFGIVCLAPVTASADLIVGFDLDLAQLDYVNSSNTLMVTQSGSSDLLVTHEDDGVMLDGAKISGGANFDFNFTLSIAQDSGTGLWSADGTFGFTDRNFNAAVAGNFTSTGMMIYPGEVLWIIGDLSTKAASESLLQNGGAFWEFLGNSSIGSDRLGYPVDGLDGEASKITVSNPNAYDEGTAWVLKFGVGTSSLDTLFASNFSKDSGEVKGVITPEPATMSLLAIGGLAVLKRRKRQMQ